MAKRTAIIDIGSNSVRMVIFEKTSRFAFHLLHEVKSRARISESAYENSGILQPEAMQRTLLALRDFISIARSYDVRKTLCVATSAVRDAPNRNLFTRRVRNELGLNIKVIDGEKESYLGGIACANLLPRMDAVTVDIGGGSTECALIKDATVTQSFSLDLGTVRLKELFFDQGREEEAAAYIDEALSRLPLGTQEHVIGIGGTFRALSRALMKRSGYPLRKLHGYSCDTEELAAFARAVLDADESGLKELGIKKERFDVIKPGALILLRMLRHIQGKRVTTSGVGVREGLFLSDLLRNCRDRFPENFNPSMRCLLDRYTTEAAHDELVGKVAGDLLELIHGDMDIPLSFKKELVIAAKLSNIGASVHFYSYHQHSYYLVQTALEYGFTHRQIMLISTLVRFQKRKRPNKGHRHVYTSLLPDDRIVEALSFILALANALLSHHPRNVDFTLDYRDKTVTVRAKGEPSVLPEEATATLAAPENISVAFV